MENDLISNEERLSTAYSNLKDKHVLLKAKMSLKKKDFTNLYHKYRTLYIRYWEMYDFINAKMRGQNSDEVESW